MCQIQVSGSGARRCDVNLESVEHQLEFGEPPDCEPNKNGSKLVSPLAKCIVVTNLKEPQISDIMVFTTKCCCSKLPFENLDNV